MKCLSFQSELQERKTHILSVANDNFHDRESHRLIAQLKTGCHLRVYHFGVSPAFAYSPTSPGSASQVRHELAAKLVESGELQVVESGSQYDVYALDASGLRKAA